MNYSDAVEVVRKAMEDPRTVETARQASEVMYACKDIGREFARNASRVPADVRAMALDAIRAFSSQATVQGAKIGQAASAMLGGGKLVAGGVTAALAIKVALGAAAILALLAGAYYGSQYLGEYMADDPVELGDQADRERDRDPATEPEREHDPSATYWCVWYADNIALKPVMVGTCDDMQSVEYRNDYPGGGRAQVEMVKVPLVENALSREQAVAKALGQFTKVRRVPASSTFVFTDWLGERGGQRHDLDEIK